VAEALLRGRISKGFVGWWLSARALLVGSFDGLKHHKGFKHCGEGSVIERGLKVFRERKYQMF